MLRIQEVTAAWAEWVAKTPPEVLATITNVKLAGENSLGYDVHISAWEADQGVVDRLAAALGIEADQGWEPTKGSSARQWSLPIGRDDTQTWHLTATTPKIDRT